MKIKIPNMVWTWLKWTGAIAFSFQGFSWGLTLLSLASTVANFVGLFLLSGIVFFWLLLGLRNSKGLWNTL